MTRRILNTVDSPKINQHLSKVALATLIVCQNYISVQIVVAQSTSTPTSPKRVFEKYKIGLVNPGDPPQHPFLRGEPDPEVPLFKGGSTRGTVTKQTFQTVSKIAQQIKPPTNQFSPRTLPVGLVVNGQIKLESFTVLGQEDGSRAISFEDWLLPFDELAQTLGFKIKEIDGKLDISTSSQRFQIPVDVVITDRTLGRAIAVRNLAKIPGFAIDFDIYKYAIDLKIPTGGIERIGVIDTPIILDGLDTRRPAGILGTSIIQQRAINSGSSNGNNTQGEFQAAGNIFDAGWYLRFNQPTFSDTQNWNLIDGVILRQRNSDDLIIGSQTPFWRNRNSTGTYWGATTVYRQGFAPPVRSSGGDFVLEERLQSKRGQRTISGLAAPGTLVQLVRSDRNQLVQEVLIDSSGVYRFENVIIGGVGEDSSIGQDYKVLLYPRGQLTANPIVRDISFTTIPGQIPVNSEAFVVSGGGNRIASGNFGSFDAAKGGVLYRRGVSEALTLGAGIAFDGEAKGVGELFWQPSEPLEIAMSATSGSQVDFLGRLSYRPSNNFAFTTSSDQFSTTANANWRMTPNFSVVSTYESLRGATVGAEYFTSGIDSSTSLRSDVSSRGQVRASASQRWENLQATLQRNESSNNAELSYRLPTEGYSDGGHEFVLGYQNSAQTINTSFTSVLWRYRSPERVGNGRYLWQSEVGYGWSGFGAGLLATVDLNVLPGLQLRSSYRGISDTSNQNSYAIELTTTLLTSDGVRGTFDRVEDFRTVGKVVFQPFLDKNQNSRQDPGEESYWDPLLIRINDRPAQQYRPQVLDDRADLNLPSGSYRLDIDPAGYPMNYRSRTDALRVEVVASGVTTVAIPLTPAYVAIGVVKDSRGDAVTGARVEATNLTTKTKVFSITNDGGFYTLEGLEQGEYQLRVSDLASTPDRLLINPASQPTQEINLTITIPTENTPAKTPPDRTSAVPASVIPYINVKRDL
jgi:hypothetical protein